jgi:hypothetical protein
VKTLLIGAMLLCGGCAMNQPRTYRLVGNAVLVPPGVASAAMTRRTFVAGVPARKCKPVEAAAIAVQARRKRLRLTVDGPELAKLPSDWLSDWAAHLETSGCIAPDTWQRLANEVVESVPLNTAISFRLVYGEAIDLWPHVRIQVDSPVMRDGSSGEDLVNGPMTVTGSAGGLQLQRKSSDNLIGYERAWYQAQPKDGGEGLRIVPASAERHVGGATEMRPQPAKNYFSFSPEAGYYRLIYKQNQTNFTALVVAGRTRVQLEDNAGKLSAGTATCELVESGFCVAIPKGVGANLFLAVTVNGREEVVPWGATVRTAIDSPGHRSEAAMATLSVSKLHNGKPTPVEFDRASTDILNLKLVGGENISWH